MRIKYDMAVKPLTYHYSSNRSIHENDEQSYKKSVIEIRLV